MDSLFKISKYGNYGIIVEGLEIDNNEYIPEDGVRSSIRNYKYSDSVTINTLSKVTSTNVKTYISHTVNTHNNITDSSTFTLTSDGLYLISHIILPNKEWLDYMLETNESDLQNYSDIIYVDSGKIYKYSEEITTELTVTELLEEDYIWYEEGPTTTVIRSDKNTFIMYFMNECFSKICKEILTSLQASKCKDNQDLIFVRDLLWMGINVIKYNIETLQLYEAQRILEKLTSCYSFCDANSLITYNNCGCNS